MLTGFADGLMKDEMKRRKTGGNRGRPEFPAMPIVGHDWRT